MKNSLLLDSEMRKIKLQKTVIRELVDKPRKMYMDGTGRPEILSLPQGIENSRQFLLLRTDILQKTVVGCPWSQMYPSQRES